MRLLFLTRSLGNGGAERQLAELVRVIDKTRFDVTLATFYTGGARWTDVSNIPKVRLTSLEKRGRWDVTAAWRNSLQLARNVKPQIVYSFRSVGNLLALSVAQAVGAKVVWGIRRSTKMLPLRDPIALLIYYLGVLLSYRADRVVYNSVCGRNLHLHRGYCENNSVIIPNGFDTEHFRPDLEARRRQREEWGFGDSESLVGIVGRLDPVKDHQLFLKAAASVSPMNCRVRFVVIGGGSDSYTNKLRQRAVEWGIMDRLLWVGESDDMVGAYNAMDIVALCSKEEGCPNVVGEAMACGVPCVVTDVGDAALMVGDTGLVVPPGSPEAMAAAWIKLLAMSTEDLHRVGLSARNRIIREYSLGIMVESTSTLLEGLVLPNA